MSFGMSVVFWVVAGALVGFAVGRSEPRNRITLSDVAIGIVGGVSGGLLWFSTFFEPQGSPPFVVAFDILTFNFFAALFGADILFLIVHSVRDWKRGYATR